MRNELEELEKIAYHEVPVNTLKKYCNPFGCWIDIEKEITKKEVLDCLKKNEQALTKTENSYLVKKVDYELARANHIKKIAYFVMNEPSEGLLIDVGIPDLGCYVDYMIDDGNHRFAGSIIAKRKIILCKIIGSEDHIKHLGLWHPNEAMKKLNSLYEEECKKKKIKLNCK